MRLPVFLEQNMAQFIARWQTFAATLLPTASTAASASPSALRDGAPEILRALVQRMHATRANGGQPPPTLAPPVAPQAHGVSSVPEPTLATAAALHGVLRHACGFDMAQLHAEFRALRADVIKLWMEQGGADHSPEALRDMRDFNEAIDDALAQSIAAYAAEIERARHLFMAIIGHDLRTPLGVITMTLQYLEMADLPEEKRRDALARISRSAEGMHFIIKDMLEFMRSRLGQGVPVTLQPAELDKVCHAALREIRNQYPHAAFHAEIGKKLSACIDPERMRQVLCNLLTNAVQHGDRSAPVTLSAEASAAGIVLRISNSGPAIAPALLPSIFDPIRRIAAGHPNEEAIPSKFGLGLFIAREIVLAHGGEIAAASSQETGTVFTVTLPAHR